MGHASVCSHLECIRVGWERFSGFVKYVVGLVGVYIFCMMLHVEVLNELFPDFFFCLAVEDKDVFVYPLRSTQDDEKMAFEVSDLFMVPRMGILICLLFF